MSKLFARKSKMTPVIRDIFSPSLGLAIGFATRLTRMFRCHRWTRSHTTTSNAGEMMEAQRSQSSYRTNHTGVVEA